MMEIELPKRPYPAQRIATRSWIKNSLRASLQWARRQFAGQPSAWRRAFQDVPSAAWADAKPSHNIRSVLIFDEDFGDLAAYAEPFEACGCEVYKCSSIEDAMRCAEREDLDFALVDEASPAFRSVRLIRHLIRYNPRVNFAVVGYSDESPFYRHQLALRAFSYFKKPVRRDEIDRLISNYL